MDNQLGTKLTFFTNCPGIDERVLYNSLEH